MSPLPCQCSNTAAVQQRSPSSRSSPQERGEPCANRWDAGDAVTARLGFLPALRVGQVPRAQGRGCPRLASALSAYGLGRLQVGTAACTSGLQLWLGSQMRKQHWCGALLEPRAAWRVCSLLRNSPEPPVPRRKGSCQPRGRPAPLQQGPAAALWSQGMGQPQPDPTRLLGPGTLRKLPPGEALGAARATGRACSRWCLYSIS